MTDEELVISYKESKNKDQVGELYKRYAHLVLGLCMKYLKDEEKAKDMCMEIFHSLYEKLKKSDVLKFKPWLYTVAKNACLMELRSKNSEMALNESIVAAEDGSELSLKHVAEEKYQAMEEALRLLKEDQAACIKAFYLKKKCYSQIADETGMDILSVKSNIQNGKRMMKIHLMKHPLFQ